MTTILARLYKRYTTSANGGRRPTETTQQKIEPQVFNPTQVVDPVQLVDPIHRVLLPLATDVNTEHRADFN